MEWYEKWPYKQIGFEDVEQKDIKENMCECCIAFIDILGFKAMANKNIEKVILALRYIKMFRDSFYRIPSRMGNPKYTEVVSEPDEEMDEYDNLPKATMFSDSIVISKEIDEYFSFSNFIQFIAQLQFELLREGILLRGGIDIGPVYHDDSFIFGSGMISAYLLESEVSKYPRITISRNTIEKIQLWDKEEFENKFKDYIWFDDKKIFLFPKDLENDLYDNEFAFIKRDSEDIIYIDYMRIGCQMIQASKEDIYAMNKYVCTNFIEDTLSKIQELIYNGIKNEDIRVREKYEWLRKYFNTTIRQIIKTYENRIVDIYEENEEMKEMLSTLLIV
ncbi:MAG: hypothetical protein HFI70_07570 [Lachnospiraceae bacterium]|nr:hypothetical protein [Lachnospiraceae bacterium]